MASAGETAAVADIAASASSRRFRRADVFWHALTALAFVAVIVLLFVKPVRAAPFDGARSTAAVMVSPAGFEPATY